MKKIALILCCILTAISINGYSYSEYDINVTQIDNSIEEIYPLSDGMRLFRTNENLWGYMDEKYQVAIEPIYGYATDFENSIAHVDLPENNSHVGINKKGEVVQTTFPRYDENGIAVTKNEENYYGFINQDGEMLTEFKYLSLTPFKNGLALAKRKDTTLYDTLIDENYNEITSDKFNFSDILDSGLIVVRDKNSLYGLVGRELNEIVPCIYYQFMSWDMHYFINGYDEDTDTFIKKGGPYKVINGDAPIFGGGFPDNEKQGYIDGDGNIVIPVEYDSLGNYMANGLISYSKDGEYGLMNAAGETLYADYERYNGDIYSIKENGVITKLVDIKDGSVIGINDIDIVSDYVDGVALATKRTPADEDGFLSHNDIYYGLVDVYGNIIRDFDIRIWDQTSYGGHGSSYYYSFPYMISDALVAVRVDEKWGYMDLSGNMIIEPQFDMAYNFEFGYAMVKMGEEYYYIDKDGNSYRDIDIIRGAEYFDYPYDRERDNKKFYFFFEMSRRYFRDYSAYNDYYLFLDKDYGVLKNKEEVIFETSGDKLIDANGEILLENCHINLYGVEEEKQHPELYFTADKNVLVKTADGNYIIEVKEKKYPDEIILTIGEKEAMVNGELCENDVAPILKGERAMLPIRFIAEKLGARVSYIEKSQLVAVTLGDREIAHIIGSDTALVNREEIKLDEPSFTQNDRTYLPIRFIEWIESENQVKITIN